MTKKILSTMIVLALFALVLAPASARMPVSEEKQAQPAVELPRIPIILPSRASITEQAEKARDLKTMAAAIKAAGLEEALKLKGPFTLFAPSDAAFAKLPEAEVAALFQDQARLRAFVLSHLVSGKLTSRDLALRDEVRDVLGAEHSLAVKGRALLVGDARVVRTDLSASNGMVHVIDHVQI